jgi:hypothetical protein
LMRMCSALRCSTISGLSAGSGVLLFVSGCGNVAPIFFLRCLRPHPGRGVLILLRQCASHPSVNSKCPGAPDSSLITSVVCGDGLCNMDGGESFVVQARLLRFIRPVCLRFACEYTMLPDEWRIISVEPLKNGHLPLKLPVGNRMCALFCGYFKLIARFL